STGGAVINFPGVMLPSALVCASESTCVAWACRKAATALADFGAFGAGAVVLRAAFWMAALTLVKLPAGKATPKPSSETINASRMRALRRLCRFGGLDESFKFAGVVRFIIILRISALIYSRSAMAV